MRWKIELLLLLTLTICLVSSIDNLDLDDGIIDDEIEKEFDDEKIDLPELQQSEINEEINYESPQIIKPENVYFAENFDNIDEFSNKWIQSKAKKDDIAEEIAKYDGEWKLEQPKKQLWKNDYGLILKSKAKHSAISSVLSKPFVFNDKPLIVQYEVTMQDGQECGGSYLKLLSLGKLSSDLKQFNDRTPYTIMFGPDKCGNDVKLHFIFRHVNPINSTITEKHCRKPKERLEEPFKDKRPHLYQLVVKPDNTFQISVDRRVVNEGSLLKDFVPPVNPPKEIDDPEDKKPEDWDEREKIPDPDSKKPDDWDDDAPPQIPDPAAVKPEGWLDDEPEMIPDPNAIKPGDWETDIDGEWEPPLVDNPICEKVIGCGQWKAPLITNPEYKGKWRAPLIDNPNYQGKWVPRKILNPDFFEDLEPFKMTAISAVGIELWSMSNDILFDNILITDEIEVADDWAAKTYDLKRKILDKESKSLWQRMKIYMGNKPEWWAVYFAYVLIPIGFYMSFLRKRVNEETFLNKMLKHLNDNPWLWGLYILLIGTPLSFGCYTFCRSGSQEKQSDAAGKAKKTDEPTLDDLPPSASEKITTADQKNSGDTVGNRTSPSPRSKKSDLEVNNKTEEDNDKVGDGDGDVDDDAADAAADEEENDVQEIESIENVDVIEEISSSQTTDQSARKRKPRKE